MIHSIKFCIRYAILAGVATIFNIASQDASLRVYQDDYAIPASIFVGTIIGLFVKYTLDKRFIFRFKAKSRRHDGGTFVLYTVMGILTTFIFWGTEYLFQYLYGTREMRYLGAVLGLAVGYLTKYQLDKRYVFRVSARS